ncbi:site-specific integrase [Sedimentitalea sp. CY04]|uniref:Site-specific integrase n=1 Tax=Parasedimentitalea denitrificans TaxID=2211118 RepID=A0ABX0W5F0_9RHOB|nr:site-specific integrase [Sedimentitalea sp. CY04]NIZ60864.1 site-specific integrase [Sedimentitalea sp. CY04]
MPFRTGKSKVYQYDIIVKGHRLRGSTGTDDFEKAKAVEADVRAEAKGAAQKQINADYSLSEALGTYFRDVSQHQPSAATTASQSKSLIAAMGGKTRITSLSNPDILAFVAKKRAKVSNATVNRQLQLLGRALRHMGKFYSVQIPELDFRAAQTKEAKERIRELSQDEQVRLFEHLPLDLHAPVKFCLMTGVRIATMTGLLWSDIHLDRREIEFRLKGGETMTFPISREMAAFLSALPKSNVISARRHVFTRINKNNLERIQIVAKGGVFNTQFRESLAKAGIEDFRFHDLRHTFATRMLRQTRDLKLVSKLLGHKSIETTSRYAHVLVDDMRSALDGFSPLSDGVPQSFPQTSKLSD